MKTKGGVVYGAKADAQIQKTVREVARRIINSAGHRGRWQFYASEAIDSSTIRFEITEADCEGRSAIVRILSSNGSVPGSYEIYGETETNEAGEVINSRFVVVYDKTGCYLNESNKNLFGRIGHATYLNGRPKYPYQPWTCFEIVALAEQQTECEAF